MMRKIPVLRTTVDMESGKVTKFSFTDFHMTPPLPDLCQTCGVKHDPLTAHNWQSMYYKYAFFSEHARWPTWGDAFAHCTPVVQAQWKAHLLKAGVKPEELEPSSD